MRGIERRIAAGLDPKVGSVASIFISRWDVAVKDKVPKGLHNHLGIAVAGRPTAPIASSWPRPLALAGTGGRSAAARVVGQHGHQRPHGTDTLYLEALAAPDTINTIPEKTLLAFADHGTVGGAMAEDGAELEQDTRLFAKAGIDEDALAARLQHEGAESFSKSWSDLMAVIADRTRPCLNHTGPGQKWGHEERFR